MRRVAGDYATYLQLVAVDEALVEPSTDPRLEVYLFGSATLFTTGIGERWPLEAGYSFGLRLLPWTGTPIIVAPLAGALSDRIGRRSVMAAGMLLQGVGLAWFAALATAGASYPGLVPALVVAGVGVSMALPTTATAMVSAASAGDMGKASGLNRTLQRFGSVFGIALATAVFAAYGQLGSAASSAAGFQPALAVAAGFSLIGAGTALGVARRPRADVVAAWPSAESV